MRKEETRISALPASRRVGSTAVKATPALDLQKGAKQPATHGRRARAIAKAIIARQTGIEQGVRGAFVRRAAGAIARIAANADEHQLQQALAAPTDIGTLAAALSESEVIGPGVRELDPMALLIARSVDHKNVLCARAGGLLNVQQVADLLGITRQAVDKRRRAHKLLALARGSDFRYPAAQFDDGEVAAGLSEVLIAVRLEGPWGTLDFLTAEHDELERETPLGWLKRHPDQLEPVLRLARAQGDHGA